MNFKNPFKRNKPRSEELREQFDRGEWIKEIENTRGFRLINQLLLNEKNWVLTALRGCKPDELERLQAYADAIDVLGVGLLRWKKEGEMAREILYGRLEAMDEMQFDSSQPNTNTPAN